MNTQKQYKIVKDVDGWGVAEVDGTTWTLMNDESMTNESSNALLREMQDSDEICKNCGETYERHGSRRNDCPTITFEHGLIRWENTTFEKELTQ